MLVFVCERFFHTKEVQSIMEKRVAIEAKIDIAGRAEHYILLCMLN